MNNTRHVRADTPNVGQYAWVWDLWHWTRATWTGVQWRDDGGVALVGATHWIAIPMPVSEVTT